ncbi:MAG: amidohydrolase [Coriobacteriales bacterium]|nr:amidohydrolase [Coriobacteriales bacterium]
MNTYADIVIKSSAIFTAETLTAMDGVVAIKDDEIMAVAGPEEASSYIGPNTKVIECGDKTVLPGFNDAHTHFLQNGIATDPDYTLNLEEVHGQDAIISAIKEFADAHPGNAWISAGSLHWEDWGVEPNRAMLDAIVPDRPAYIASWDMHTGWMNTKALEAVGYTKDTPDPEGGIICREADGTPSGFCKEPAACDPVWGLANISADMDHVLGRVIDEALSYGVTATGCVYPYGGIPEEETIKTFQDFESRGKLPIRVSMFLRLLPGLVNPKKFETQLRSEHLRFAGLKEITDGVCEAHTGYLTEPYADDPSTCGHPSIGYDELFAMVDEADSNGYPVRLHAIGNGAVKQALDVFEAVQRKNGFKHLRNTIEHIESCRPEDLGRFAQLGVTPSMQPIHSVLNVDGYPELLGEKWRPYMWPVKSLMDSGAVVGFGTDAPVWNLNPMDGIYAAITRQQPWDGYPEGGFVPEQRISVAQALQAYTYSSAYAEGFENRIGTLHAGKLADVVVMDRNLLDSTPDQILHAKVLCTMIDGKIVYQAEDGELTA